MTTKKTNKMSGKKVNEVLKEQELSKVTGGQYDYPLKPVKPQDQKPGKTNPIFPIPFPL